VLQEFDAGSLLNTCTTACQDSPSPLCQPGEGTSRPVQEFWRGKCSDWFGLYVGNKTVIHSIGIHSIYNKKVLCVCVCVCVCVRAHTHAHK
jgi:hypothetical protein